jgi:hypothetical protein
MCSADRPSEAPRVRADAALLLEIARRSIACGLETGEPLAIDASRFALELREPRASFVTLRRAGALRGCVGSLEASRPLVSDIAHNAFGAAFRDGRFAPLVAWELADLEISAAILSALEPILAPDERTLLERIRPGIDGLVLRCGERQGTFLPAVWENLREPSSFWRELKRKAGLPVDAWSRDWSILRYTVESLR